MFNDMLLLLVHPTAYLQLRLDESKWKAYHKWKANEQVVTALTSGPEADVYESSALDFCKSQDQIDEIW